MASISITRPSRAVSAWLFFMIFLVISMILVGGATRLTNSGLSITEWKPITGILPPLNNADWISEFEKYKLIPEFSAEHPDMLLAQFKFIYFMEWSHRELGRLIGLAYLIPLLNFAGLGKIERGKGGRFILIFLLICLQGAIGWWMVKSGLTGDRIDVAPYRLAVHLGLAFIILGLLFWTWRDQVQRWPAMKSGGKLKRWTGLLLMLTFLQIIAGALVAGSHAGLTYNTWPLMDGDFVPSGLWGRHPWWINMFENVVTIQFNHRMIGYLLLLAALWVWFSARRLREDRIRKSVGITMMFIFLQITLGVIALLQYIELPYALAHQAGAVLVFLSVLSTARTARISRY